MHHLLGLHSPMKLELMSYLSVLLLAFSLACGGSGNMYPGRHRTFPLRPQVPMSTDGPIWVLQRL